MRAAALIAGVIAAATGCGGDDEPFRLKISWRDGADQGCPVIAADAERRCESIPMTCAAKARIRIVDAKDPDLSYFTQCFDLPAGGDACKLGDLEIPRRAIPNTMVKVQVAVWPVSTLADVPPAEMVGGCPISARFQLNGLPEPSPPLPALGGEAYFDVGHDRTAEVERGSPDSDGAECRDNRVSLIATLFDIRDFRRPGPIEVRNITVKWGRPEDLGGGVYAIDNDSLRELKRVEAGEVRWKLELDAPPVGVQCLSVLFQEGPSTPALTCFEPVVDVNGELHARGFIVRKARVDEVLRSIGRAATGFPPEGLVIGLVLDDTDLPVAEAVVASSPPSTPMFYPQPGFDPVLRDETSQLGLFVSDDAPWNASWTGIDMRGVTDNGAARGGLVQGQVSVVIVNMGVGLAPIDAGVTGPPGPLDAGVDAP